MLFLELTFGIAAGLYLHDNLKWGEERVFVWWRKRQHLKDVKEATKKQEEALEVLRRTRIERNEGEEDVGQPMEQPVRPEAPPQQVDGQWQTYTPTMLTSATTSPGVSVQWDAPPERTTSMPWREG